MKRAALACCLAACGGSSMSPGPDAAPLAPTDNPSRDVTATDLEFNLSAMSATAAITLAPSGSDGATLETGNLDISKVTGSDGEEIPFMQLDGLTGSGSGTLLELGLPASSDPVTVNISYKWQYNEDFTGISQTGYTFTWPYFCGDMFPCHSNPVDGTTFTLDLTNVPLGQSAVFPTTIPTAAPPYQLAWAIGEYTELPLGTTSAGTAVSMWYRNPTEMAAAMTSSTHLVAAWDWLETTIGPYRFGNKVGGVPVTWPDGEAGGMEHHPFWHVATSQFNDENTQVHESSHGWYGDGIRIGCWEDFVLSEGTVCYLAGRALDVVDPANAGKTWTDYAKELNSSVTADQPVWPTTCGAVDVIKDNLFTDAPYMRGAFFYRAVALKVGDTQLDDVLHTFYMAHQGTPATMDEMLTTIQQVTGFDPTDCANKWLRNSTSIPTPNVSCDSI
jgi:aminopeptidase N